MSEPLKIWEGTPITGSEHRVVMADGRPQVQVHVGATGHLCWVEEPDARTACRVLGCALVDAHTFIERAAASFSEGRARAMGST